MFEGPLERGTTARIRERVLEQGAAERRIGHGTRNLSIEPDDDVNQWVAFLPNKGKVFRTLINNARALEMVRCFPDRLGCVRSEPRRDAVELCRSFRRLPCRHAAIGVNNGISSKETTIPRLPMRVVAVALCPSPGYGSAATSNSASCHAA